MIKLKKLIFLSCFCLPLIALQAQTRTITGKVTSAKDNSGLSSATVSIKETNQSAASDADGNFSISSPAGKVVLVFSSVGFEPKEVSVGADQNSVTVSLTDDARQLNEVVVTALGISRQAKSLTYATQKLNGDNLNEAKEVNIINALQGKVAGVTITKNASGPGSASKVILRGNRSIFGNNQPLYVIDGVPLDNSTRSQAGGTFGGRDGGDGIGMVNPDEIETMNILRGASAAALYGSAGQNGAIIITTKRGKAGKISLDYNGGVMFDKAAVFPELQYQYGQGDGGVYSRNSEHSWGPKISGQKDTLWNGSVVNMTGQTNRLKDFFRTALTVTNSVAVTGGSEKMQTYFFYGNTNAEGILSNHDLNRHNVTLKVNNNITSKLSIESKLSYIHENVNNKPFIGEAPNSVISLYRSPVSIPLNEMQKFENLDASGNLKQSYWKPNSSILENPYWIMNRDKFYENKDRIIGLLTAKYQFTDWLNFQLRGSFDKTNEKTEGSVYNDSYYSLVGSNYSLQSLNHISSNIDALLNFKRTISKDILLSGFVGGAVQAGNYDALSTNANGLNKQNFFFMSNAKAPQVDNSYGKNPQVQSVYASASFGYKNYLFLDATGRNDWSSALPKENRSYFYPSVGLTGIISEMVSLPNWISYGKVRASFAGSGSGGSQYFTRTYFSVQRGGGIGTPSIRSIADYKPELTQSWELGLDWRFLQNRIGLDVTFYNASTKNQLLLLGTPAASLFAEKYINAGLIRNKGIELVLTLTPVKTRGFEWDMTVNFAKNKNKIEKLNDQIKSAILIDDRDAAIKAVEGGSYGDLYVKSWQKDAQGRRLVDPNGKAIFTGGNDTYIGNYNPDFTMGIGNNLSYKNLSFSFLIDWRKGGKVISGTQALIDADGHSKRSLEGRENGLILDAYFENGKKNDKKINANEFWSAIGDRYPVGELYTYSATNVRMREVTLGYRLPLSLVERTKVFKAAKVSLVGRNLFFFKRDAPYDPEIAVGTVNGGGLEYGSLPSTRSMGVNIKLSF
jgi:TonB-linked SusC/RagA family outer membrane protein